MHLGRKLWLVKLKDHKHHESHYLVISGSGDVIRRCKVTPEICSAFTSAIGVIQKNPNVANVFILSEKPPLSLACSPSMFVLGGAEEPKFTFPTLNALMAFHKKFEKATQIQAAKNLRP